MINVLVIDYSSTITVAFSVIILNIFCLNTSEDDNVTCNGNENDLFIFSFLRITWFSCAVFLYDHKLKE